MLTGLSLVHGFALIDEDDDRRKNPEPVRWCTFLLCADVILFFPAEKKTKIYIYKKKWVSFSSARSSTEICSAAEIRHDISLLCWS